MSDLTDFQIALGSLGAFLVLMAVVGVVLTHVRQRRLDQAAELEELADADERRRTGGYRAISGVVKDLRRFAAQASDALVETNKNRQAFEHMSVRLVRDLHEIVEAAATGRDLEALAEIEALRQALAGAEADLADQQTRHTAEMDQLRAELADVKAEAATRVPSRVAAALAEVGPQPAHELARWIGVVPDSEVFHALTADARHAGLIRSGPHVNGVEKVYWLADDPRPGFVHDPAVEAWAQVRQLRPAEPEIA